MFQDESATSDGAPNPIVEYVGCWPRVFAYVLDLLILFPAVYAAGRFMGQTVALNLFKIGLYLLYRFLHWQRYGATLGMKILRQRIVLENLQKADTAVVLRRLMAALLCDILLYLPYLSIAFDSRHQGFHDKVAHTVVIRQK